MMQNPHDKHASSNQNKAYVVKYTSNGATLVKNPQYDPKACPKCGKRHGMFQKVCK